MLAVRGLRNHTTIEISLSRIHIVSGLVLERMWMTKILWTGFSQRVQLDFWKEMIADRKRAYGQLLFLKRLTEGLPVIRQADDSGLSDKVPPKMLKTYCSPIETLLYMGIQ
jgi:hypothetical protein